MVYDGEKQVPPQMPAAHGGWTFQCLFVTEWCTGQIIHQSVWYGLCT
jgi:hypothetical protein